MMIAPAARLGRSILDVVAHSTRLWTQMLAAPNTPDDANIFGALIHDVVTAAVVTRFEADATDGGIAVTWSLANPTQYTSVTLERSDGRTGPWTTVAAELRAEGGATVALDRSAAPGGTYYYRLSVSGSSGRVIVFGPLVGTAGTPIKELALTRVAPNPTSGSVQIEYAVPRDGPVQLRVLDVEGRTVMVLTSGPLPRGRYHAAWGGQTALGPARTGMYFVQLQLAGQSVFRRLALVR